MCVSLEMIMQQDREWGLSQRYSGLSPRRWIPPHSCFFRMACCHGNRAEVDAVGLLDY